MFAAGSIGAIAGTILAGFAFIPWLGSSLTLLVVTITYVISGLFILLLVGKRGVLIAAIVVGKVREVLRAEREAIVSGNYAALDKIALDKERAFDRLAAVSPPIDQLRHIKAEVESNQMLMGSALRGFRSAMDRLEAMRKVQDGQVTYGADGQLIAQRSAQSKLEKKA